MKAELERVWGRDCFACNITYTSETQSHSSLMGIITSHVLCSLWSTIAANQKDSSENQKCLPRIGRVLREAEGFLQGMLGLYTYITFSRTSTLIPTISVSVGTSVSNPTTGSGATSDVWRYFSRKSSSAITVCSLCHKVLDYRGDHEDTSGTTSPPGYYISSKIEICLLLNSKHLNRGFPISPTASLRRLVVKGKCK